MEEKLYNFKDKEYTEAQLQQVADSKKISLDDLFAKNPSISAVENPDIDKSENLGSEKDSNNKNLKEEEEDLYSRGVYATFKNKDFTKPQLEKIAKSKNLTLEELFSKNPDIKLNKEEPKESINYQKEKEVIDKAEQVVKLRLMRNDTISDEEKAVKLKRLEDFNTKKRAKLDADVQDEYANKLIQVLQMKW